MEIYRVRYQKGQSMPYETFDATDELDFWDQLSAWESKTGLKHVFGTIVCVGSGYRRVLELKRDTHA